MNSKIKELPEDNLALKMEKEDFKNRAKAVGLTDNSTREEVLAEELKKSLGIQEAFLKKEPQIKDLPETNKAQRDSKAELLARARAVGLDDRATEKEVSGAEDND